MLRCDEDFDDDLECDEDFFASVRPSGGARGFALRSWESYQKRCVCPPLTPPPLAHTISFASPPRTPPLPHHPPSDIVQVHHTSVVG